MPKFVLKNSNGLKLKGELIDFEPGKPVILLVHGFGGFMKEPQFIYWKKYFTGKAAVCAFDFTNGLGSSQRSPKYLSFENYRHDLALVIKYLETMGVSKIYAIGHSLGGGLLVDYVANVIDPKIVSLALVNPFLVYDESAIVKNSFMGELVVEGKIILRRGLKSIKANLTFLDELMAHNVQDELGAYKIPTLLILGRRDKVVPGRHAEEVAKNLGDGYQIIWYDDLGHFFWHPNARQLLPDLTVRINKWFNLQ